MGDWVCLNCRSINNPSATACYSCATPRHLAEATPEQLAAPIATPASTTAESIGTLTPMLDRLGSTPALDASSAAPPTWDSAQAPAVEQAPTNLVGGLLAGLAAAVVGTLVWYGAVVLTEYQVGFVAAGIGWLVGFAVVFGARGRASLPLVAASGIFTILALGMSQYLIEFHFAAQAFGLELELADLIQPIDFVFEVIVESLQADPVTLVFWAIALFGAVSVPFRSMSPGEG